MYTFDYRFYPKKQGREFLDEYIDCLSDFMVSLIFNGQILSDHSNLTFPKRVYVERVVAPEKNSLRKKHYNKYCREGLEKLLSLSAQPPDFILVDDNYDTGDVCVCGNTLFYVLHTSKYDCEPPVLCGSCGDWAPLYRLPKTYDFGYFDVWQWQLAYRSYDRLFMEGTGERYAHKMLRDPKSALSLKGRDICAFWEGAVGKPFYYYLFRYYGKNKKNCPVCGEDWVNRDEGFRYPFVCHKCRLVSEDIGG